MLAKWTKVLPFFVIEWIAKRKCESHTSSGVRWAVAYPGVWFVVKS
jgi:hypothetical protein